MVCYRSAINRVGVLFMAFRHFLAVAALGAILSSAPAAAQWGTDADRFVTAVKERRGSLATDLLTVRPALIDSKDHGGDTGLIVAISRRDFDWITFLLEKGADPDIAARSGDTPLIIAARLGYFAGARELLARKAKVDAPNRKGETALIIAVQQRDLPLVRLLLSVGANPDKTDNAAGYSARDYAKRDARSREILRLIESRKPAA